MNCRQVSKLMPEMAAGELGTQQEARAREHLRSCNRCARELAYYEEALGAMSQPWEMLEVPDDLELVLPGDVRRSVRLTRLVPALGLALLIVLALSVMPRTHKPIENAHRPVAVVTPEKKPIVKETAAAEPKMITNAAIPDDVEAPKHAEREKRIRHREHARKMAHNKPKTFVKHDTPVAAVPSNKEAAPAAEPLPTVIVIASSVPEPELPEIYIESVNQATGEVTMQSVITDENGSIRESEVRFKAAGTNEWRDSL